MFQARFVIRHAHVDHFGIAYFPRIIELCHQSYESWWDTVGMPYASFFADQRIGFPVVEVKARFVRPLRHSEEVVDEITVLRVSRSSVHWRHRLRVDEEPAAEVEVHTVCVSMDDRRSCALPGPVREALQSLVVQEDG